MRTITLIPARSRPVGDLTVLRTLPSRQRRLVGPFIFWDHMGPVTLEPGRDADVRPHPHINLATVTYLFAGELVHRDSLGSEQPIRPGDVNWMTAARGIVHSERMTPAQRKAGATLHGLQVWVALPVEQEESEPSFQHVAGASLPVVSRPAATVRVVAGTAFGATSPVRVTSPMFYVEAMLEAGAALELPDGYSERATYVVEGTVQCNGQRVDRATMAVADATEPVTLRALEPSRVMLLGGEPVGERYIWWNFVSSSQERIERAKREWKDGAFAKIPGDDQEFVPLPE
jgi:redox-sensitive bicupin YhaK (pirin superfamily)